jgi:hypothetical protein
VADEVITKLAGRNRTITEDPMTGDVTATVHRERASYHLPAIDLGFEADAEEHYRIREGRCVRHHTGRHPDGNLYARLLHDGNLRDRGHSRSLRGRTVRGKARVESKCFACQRLASSVVERIALISGASTK